MFTSETASGSPRRLKPQDVLYFLHIPKTGGTSFTYALSSRFKWHEVYVPWEFHKLMEHPRETLSKYRLFCGHFGYNLPEVLRREPVTVTLVRDPVERVISYYQQVSRDKTHYMHTSVKRMSLAEFVRDERTRPELQNYQVSQLLWSSAFGAPVLEPGKSYAIPGAPETVSYDWLVEKALARLEQFAFVGLTERMRDSLRLLAYTFGWKKFREIPKLNVSRKKLTKADLGQDTLEVIHKLTEADARLHAHAQQLFETRLARMHANLTLANAGEVTSMFARWKQKAVDVSCVVGATALLSERRVQRRWRSTVAVLRQGRRLL